MNRLFFQYGKREILMTKEELRKIARNRRNSIMPEQVLKNSEIIQNRLCVHPWFISSHNVFIYISKKSEVCTDRIIDTALRTGKTVCVPRVHKNGMYAVPVKKIPDDLEKGYSGTLEPKSSLEPISEKEIELVIVPGIIFDIRGYRIGYGGGYYDRYLSIIPPECKTIGLAFSNQLTNGLPHEAYDRKVMLIITEKEMIGG